MWLEPARRDGRKYLNPVPTSVGGASTMWKMIRRVMESRGKERVPSRPLGPFRTDASVYAVPPESGLRVTWMGHSSLLIELDGVRILTDPVWLERASPLSWAGPKRFFAAPLSLRDLPALDAVILSHDHYDHLGAETVRALARLDVAQWICPLGVGAELAALGVDASRCVELDWTDAVQVGDVQVTALPTRHFAGRSLLNRNQTLWASYALIGPRHRVYYGGDSGEWPGFAEIGERFGPFDLTMLEIGASDPLWKDIHMGPEGALRSFQALGGHGLFMPIHWGLFNLAFHAWTEPIERVWREPGMKLWLPVPGVPTEVVKDEPLRLEWWR